MTETFVATPAQTIFMDTIRDATHVLFWPIQLLTLPVLWVAYIRFRRSFMLLLLISHVLSLVHYGLTDPQVHCWVTNTFHLFLPPSTTFALYVWGYIAWFFYVATRASAILLCALHFLQRSRTPNTAYPIAASAVQGERHRSH